MALKSDLESREAEYKTANNFVALANEALADPADADYTRELLTKGEMNSQFPADYIKVAESYRSLAVAVGKHLDDKAWVQRLYDEAATQCRGVARQGRRGVHQGGRHQEPGAPSQCLPRRQRCRP